MVDHGQWKRPCPWRAKDHHRKADRFAVLDQIGLQKFLLAARPRDDGIRSRERCEVGPGHVSVRGAAAALEVRLQTATPGHLVGCGEAGAPHLECAFRDNSLKAQPPLLDLEVRIVADRINDARRAILADGFNEQDVLEAAAPQADPGLLPWLKRSAGCRCRNTGVGRKRNAVDDEIAGANRLRQCQQRQKQEGLKPAEHAVSLQLWCDLWHGHYGALASPPQPPDAYPCGVYPPSMAIGCAKADKSPPSQREPCTRRSSFPSTLPASPRHNRSSPARLSYLRQAAAARDIPSPGCQRR